MIVKEMIFTESPSALYTLWKAYQTRKTIFEPVREYPEIHASRPGFAIDETHVREFQRICGLSKSDSLPILYPFTLVYPYIMRVLCSEEVPVSLFKILNTRNSITLHRRINPDERYDMDCYNATPRIIPKGLEVDIHSSLSSGGNTVWENVTTYFYPGNFGPAEALYQPPRLAPLADGEVIKEWYLPAQDRFKFARISGDTNGIHYGKLYAQMMGFKRDFVQPIRVVAQCVASLPPIDPSDPMRLDFYLKGPIYYESTLILKNAHTNKSNRFDLFCRGNEKPVISGILHSA